jgi:hypothetical protein
MSQESFDPRIVALQEQVNALADENAQLRRERDWAYSLVTRGVPMASEEQEQQFIREMQCPAEPGGLAKLIAELETANG